ncbi:DUF4932 domain-containing protein [bacterium]|nr:DUF4932 domain-containing protein [bacterium]
MLTILIFSLLLFSLPAVSFATDFRLPDPVTLGNNRITVGVFPQVELISIVQAVSNYPDTFAFLMAKDSSDYASDAARHFRTYSDHPAVRMLDRLSLKPGMMNFSAPSNIMLLADESLRLREDIDTDEFVIRRAGGIDSLSVFMELLRDFAVRSSFSEFFAGHREFYLSLAEKTVSSMGHADYIGELENFYGRSQRSYNIVLVSLYGPVGFGNSLLHADQDREIYNTIGPRSVKDGRPLFDDGEYLRHMIRHEFSHPYINPLTEKYWDLIKEYSGNYELIPETARKNVCGDWQECINEFVIRAITTHLAYKISVDEGDKAYAREKSRGVNCLDELLKNIRFFESERDTFPTFDSFYPTMLKVFQDLD